MKLSPIIKKAFELYIDEKSAPGDHAAEEILGLYLEGLLSEKEKAGLEAHLADCRECLEIVLTLREMEITPGEASFAAGRQSAWRDKLQEILSPRNLYIQIKTLKENMEVLFTSGKVLTAPSPLFAVRGAEPQPAPSLVTVQKFFDVLKIEVEVEEVKGEKEVKVALMDRRTGELKKGLRVTLFRQERLLASYVAREGRVLFSNLGAGKYHIKIFDQQQLVGQVILDIKGESHER